MHNDARLAGAYLRANGKLSESNEQENYARRAVTGANARSRRRRDGAVRPPGMLTSQNEQDQGEIPWSGPRE
jgi:hypothetical protein